MTEPLDPHWAWEPYQPSPASPWDLKKVGHLYRRAAFGANWTELEAGLRDGPGKTIERLLKGGPGQEAFLQQTDALARSIEASNNGQQLRAWWLYRMLYSPHPTREKLTLFWHNHFATSNKKVNNAGYMLGQYRLMYREALGNFRTLLQDMSKDPAMLVWLDTSQSRKGMPNENYARELMELFSLGIGHYTEVDIREAARAFTGWELKNGQSVINPRQHDEGEKTVLQQKGRWQGSDIVRICLDQPAAAGFMVRKLYRFLISEQAAPPASLVEPLAERFRRSDYDFGALVETMLRSNLFFSPNGYRARIKSPVDFTLGVVRGLEGRIGTTALADALEELGQNLFNPPSVKGWDGGPIWLNGQTLLFRNNLALALTSTEDGRFGRRTDPAVLVRKYPAAAEGRPVDFFLRLFLQNDVPDDTRARLEEYERQSTQLRLPAYWSPQDGTDHRVRTLCHLVLTLPEAQLD